MCAAVAKTTAAQALRAVAPLLSARFGRRKAQLLYEILRRRTRVSLVLENIYDVLNGAACMRSADAFGIQNVHIIAQPTKASTFLRNHSVTAGTFKWLTVHTYTSTAECVARLREDGHAIVASDLSPGAVPIGDLFPVSSAPAYTPSPLLDALRKERDALVDDDDDEPSSLRRRFDEWKRKGYPPLSSAAEDDAVEKRDTTVHGMSADGGGASWADVLCDVALGNVEREAESGVAVPHLPPEKPLAVVFGNERQGITDEMRATADARFIIPMEGFAQSLNVGASAAATFSHLRASGALSRHPLSDEEAASVLATWLTRNMKLSRREMGGTGLGEWRQPARRAAK